MLKEEVDDEDVAEVIARWTGIPVSKMLEGEKEKHAVARLIGAPPGYVGYEEGGYLTEAVRRRPYSVVLFDEIEKAHPEVFNVLLQILDDGRMTDGQGRTVDFKNTIVIMTSNIGSQWIQELAVSNRQELENRVTEALRAHYKPEFLNRIDETIIFQNLTLEQIVEIVTIQVKKLTDRLADRKIDLIISEQAMSFIAQKGYDPIYGARPLKRVIQQYIENPLSMDILKGNILDGNRVSAEVDGDQVVFKTI